MLYERDGDRWLQDVLAEALPSKRSSSGFVDLKLAIARNDAGQPGDGLRLARRAEAIFAATNRAAWTRAKLEEVYSLHRLINGRSCLAQSIALQHELRNRDYAWIEIQTDLEASVCATMLGDFAAARPPLRRAHDLASKSYENLNLRTLGLEAALETVTGNTASAWFMDRSGLARYFGGAYAPQRGYQFYSDLSFIAQRWGRWFLATLFSKEAEDLISTTANRSMTAMAAYRHGMLANAAGLPQEASAAFARASDLFSQLPASDSATAIYRTEGEVSRAAIESNLDRLAEAQMHLRNAAAWIPQITDITVLLRYYRTLGLVLVHDGDTNGAQTAFETAVSISKRGSSSRETAGQRASWNEEIANIYRALTELLLRRRKQPEEALRVWEQYRSGILRPGVKIRIPNRQFTLSAGSPRSTVLTYVVFADGLAIWLFDGQTLTSRWVDVPQPELRNSAERFAQECATSGSSNIAISRDGHWLFERLIQPIAALLTPHQPILLELDGPVTEVPFAALPGISSQYLADEHPITISLGPASNSRIASIDSKCRALIVASGSLGADSARTFPPLPDAIREATDLAGRFTSPKLLVGSSANYTSVRNELPRADVFHFAGHAISDASGGALLLTGESGAASLGGTEIEALPLRRCRLAVLAACTTAAGDGAAHAEGLAGSFLRAGARQVVAVRWVVDSSAATKYTDVLYRALLSGDPLQDAAYRAASSLRSKTETAHPCYWAGFQAYQAASPWIIITSSKGF